VFRSYSGYVAGPALVPYAPKLPEIFTKFTTYKLSVPVMGAIILNPSLDKVVLLPRCILTGQADGARGSAFW
jgi:hypothetical protein